MERDSVKGNSIMGCRVLVADGNTDAAESLAAILAHFGHEAVTATCGPAALEQLSLVQFDVAFLALHLPEMNGLEVCRQMRSGRFGPRPRVIVALTGDSGEENRRASLDAGFDYHILKPASPHAILALLESIPANCSAVCSCQ
jgi:CheY-like chemotaxis protein